MSGSGSLRQKLHRLSRNRRTLARLSFAILGVSFLAALASSATRKGLQAGAEDFISKPFEPAELFARIRHLLRVNDTLGARLASIHNLRFYLRLLEEARAAIRAGTFAALREKVRLVPVR